MQTEPYPSTPSTVDTAPVVEPVALAPTEGTPLLEAPQPQAALEAPTELALPEVATPAAQQTSETYEIPVQEASVTTGEAPAAASVDTLAPLSDAAIDEARAAVEAATPTPPAAPEATPAVEATPSEVMPTTEIPAVVSEPAQKPNWLSRLLHK